MVIELSTKNISFCHPFSLQNFILTIVFLEWTKAQSVFVNGLWSIYQYSNMGPRLSGQTSLFGGVFFVSKSLLGIERQKKL